MCDQCSQCSLRKENHRLSAKTVLWGGGGILRDQQAGSRQEVFGWAREDLLPLPLGVGGGEDDGGDAGAVVLLFGQLFFVLVHV